jgi:hypothetical protein
VAAAGPSDTPERRAGNCRSRTPKQKIERCLVRMRFPAFHGRDPVHEHIRKPAKEFVFVQPDPRLPSRRQLRALFGAPSAPAPVREAPPPGDAAQGPPEDLGSSSVSVDAASAK